MSSTHQNPSQHEFLTTIARCLGAQWLIDAGWLYQNADLMARADRSEDMSAVWPKMESKLMMAGDGGYVAAAPGGSAGKKGNAMGVISVVGPVYKYGWNSSKNLLYYLDQLAKHDQVGSVKIKVDSPGGQMAGTREVYEAVMNYPKPLLVVVDGFMASASVYQWAGASRIVSTQPTDQIGSIGTYSTIADWNAYYESFGLTMYETYAPKSTEKNESYRQLLESKGEKRQLLEAELTVLNDQFIADVRAARGKQLSTAVEKGRLYFAPEAQTMGLIDDLVSEAETFSVLADMYATSKQTTIQMGLKEKIMAVFADDDAPETPTVEQLTAQVTQLTTERDAAQATIATLTTAATTAQEQITALTTKCDGLQVKVTAFGAQPGALGTVVKKDKDETPAGQGDVKSLREIIDELPSEKEARLMFGD